jgi:hypothetical protein
MKTSVALGEARDTLDDDTVGEGQIVAAVAACERLIWLAAGDGEVTPEEVAEIVGSIRAIREACEQSLDRNRLVAALLCASVAGLDPRSAKAAERLPWLPGLRARFVEREDAAEPEEIVA